MSKASRSLSVPFLFLLLLSACVTVNLPDEISGDIPKGSEVVVIASDKQSEDLFTEIYRELGRRGYGIADANQELGSITTEYTAMGDMDANLQVRVFIEPTEGGSVGRLRGSWSLGSFSSNLFGVDLDKMDASWGGPSDKRTHAFAELIEIALSISNQGIRYE